ncbi:MAG: amidohydrolase family protein [Spirochaetes bacterium]|nr:amidohydrolase family protein [Spirochaetota bacterium]
MSCSRTWTHPASSGPCSWAGPREPDALQTLKRFLDAGFRAVKMFPPAGFFPDDERCLPLYEEIEKRGVPFVMAHCGYPHLMEAWSVAHANQNVYLDISGSGPWTDGIPLFYNAIGGQNFIPIDFARVVWGSDNCLPQAEHIARMSTYMRQIGAGSRERKLIFGENARALLRLA